MPDPDQLWMEIAIINGDQYCDNVSLVERNGASKYHHDRIVGALTRKAERLEKALLWAKPYVARIRDTEIIDQALADQCEHKWVDATNEKVSGAMVCLKCMAIAPLDAQALADSEETR